VSEVEAAKTYDLFAMAFQGNKAKLNFSYSGAEVLEVIENYIKTGKVDNSE